jgi:hypothetical protein
LALAAAKDCQYALLEGGGFFWPNPIGINRCNYYVTSKKETSFMFTCINANNLSMSYFKTSANCYGGTGENREVTYYTSDDMEFDCSSDHEECGKIFGYKTDCDCTLENGDCELAVGLSIVDEFCYSSGLGDSHYKWEITCGSVSDAQGIISYYENTACSGSAQAQTFQAGCYTNDDYSILTNYTSDTIDWIVCPGNMATLSLSLIFSLIAGALAM